MPRMTLAFISTAIVNPGLRPGSAIMLRTSKDPPAGFCAICWTQLGLESPVVDGFCQRRTCQGARVEHRRFSVKLVKNQKGDCI